MQKAVGHILAVLRRILWIGLSLQIVMGLIWMLVSFTGFQRFGESFYYIEVSKSLLCDEYTGALYPILVMLARGIEGLLHIPYTYVIYFLQLAVAGYAGYFFLKAAGMENKITRVWGSLGIMTFPMVMQCHMAVLPYSLVSSVLLLELACMIEVVRSQALSTIWKLFHMSICWVLTGLLLPEYLYIGGAPVVLLFLYSCVKRPRSTGKSILYQILLVAAFAGMIVAVTDLTQEEGCYGRVHKSVNAALYRRFVTSNIETYYWECADEVGEEKILDFLPEVIAYPDNVERLYQRAVQEAVGAERAEELFGEVAWYALSRDYRSIIHEVFWDVSGFVVPPVILELLLQGRGYDAYGGRNYEIMRQNAPALTKLYVEYSSNWLLLGIGISALMQLLLLLKKQKIRSFPGIVCIITGGVIAVWYTMQGAGIWDYKQGLLIGELWMAWMVLLAGCSTKEEGQCRNENSVKTLRNGD